MTKNPDRVYLGKSENHVSFSSPLKIRLVALWRVLTTKNFILIHRIKEFEENGNRGRELVVTSLTEYDNDSDQLSCLGACEIIKRSFESKK